MTLAEKIGLVNRVCDAIKKLNEEDASKYHSNMLIMNVIRMETLNIELVRLDMIAEIADKVAAENEDAISEFEKRMVGEEEP